MCCATLRQRCRSLGSNGLACQLGEADKLTPMSETVTQWEYFTAPILSHVAQQILNNFGSEGWELIQLAPGPNPDTLVGYFKRPLVGQR